MEERYEEKEKGRQSSDDCEFDVMKETERKRKRERTLRRAERGGEADWRRKKGAAN